MSSFLEEEVPPVRPLGIAAIEELGRCFLEQVMPDALKTPQALNVAQMSDEMLPHYGIHTIPASIEELGDRAGATDPKGNGDVNILVSEEVWEDLVEPPPRSYFARSTICHEVGHAVLHVPTLRRQMLLTTGFNRVKRRKLKAYEDPEWQAWMFAGSILLPSSTLRMLANDAGIISLREVSEVFEVSEAMARSHMKRLKWCMVGA